jgi:hypothetical protein
MAGFDGSINIYSGRKLVPIYKPEKADELPINLVPNQRYERGRLLGHVATPTNDVQTLTVTGTPTGGSLVIRAFDPFGGGSGTFVLPFDANAATAQTAVRSVLGPHITVSGGPLPGTALVFTASGSFVSMPINLMQIESNLLTGGATPGGGASFVHTTIGANSGQFGKYDPAGPDNGLRTARRINAYEVAVDSGGNVTFGPVAVEGYNGEVFPAATAYVSGYFDTKELYGLDATAVGQLGRLVHGTVADGILEF